MTRPVLTRSRLQKGIWHASVASADQPQVSASIDGRDLDQITCAPGDGGQWEIAVSLPADMLHDGLQTVLLRDATGAVIGQLPILAGAPLADDLRAEIALLRAELDILKAAFRRQASEGRP
jgi:hypothetical protein